MAVDNIARAMASKSGGSGSGGAVLSVNGQTGDVNLTSVDVGALPNTTTVPTKTSQLTNDNGFVIDVNYVHTDNNFTTDDKNKINDIPTKTSELINDSNFITDRVNDLINYYNKDNINSSLNDKADKSELPTKLSQLSNDSNFIKNTVNNLTNYYNTTSSYNKTEVNNLVSAISSLSLQKVNVLPIENISTTTIYLLLKTGSVNNIYEQYINLTGTVDGYEMIGTTEVSLDNYYDKLETDILLDNKVDSNDLVDINDKIGNEDLKIGNSLSDAVNQLKILVDNVSLENDIRRYGIRIKIADGNPDTRVEYLFDAVGKKPAKMNFITGQFDYGDWGDIWFIKENRPVMLRSNGSVDYELNHNDHSLKLDGTPSDIENPLYDGNAMSEIPLVWVKRYTDNVYNYIIYCKVKYDETYFAYAHMDELGKFSETTYLPMYEGSVESNKMRSLSNTVPSNQNYSQEEESVKLNGERWHRLSFSDCNLMYEICTIISKSTNSQNSFGNGNCTNQNYLKTGTMNNLGQFYGYSEMTKGVKLLYCENFFGNYYKRLGGIIAKGHNVSIQSAPPYLTYPNGSKWSGTPLWIVNGTFYAKDRPIFEKGSLPFGSQSGVSNSMFECDQVTAFDMTDVRSVLFGGTNTMGYGCGLSCYNYNTNFIIIQPFITASICCKSPTTIK